MELPGSSEQEAPTGGPRGGAKALIWVLRKLSPRQAEAAERESKEWTFICGECGHARSYWEVGGIRYKAASKGKRTVMRCPRCGVRRVHSVERRRAADPA